MAVRYHLTAVSGLHKGRMWAIDDIGLLLGREATCDICLMDPVVSRRQCRVLLREDGVFLEDTDSRNPILVNGAPVTHALLHAGDTLALGRNTFLVSDLQASAAPSDMDFPLEATAAWDKDSPVLLHIEEARQRVDLRPNSLADLVFLYDLTRDLSGRPSRDAFLDALESRVRERFHPMRYNIAFPRGETGFFFHSPCESVTDPAGQAVVAIAGECLKDVPGILRPGVIELEGGKQRLFTMAAPLLAGDTCLGVVVVQTHTPVGVYDEDDLKLLVLLAGSAAPILYILEDKDLLESDNTRLRALAGESNTLIGPSRKMGTVRKQLRTAAKASLNVLLTGETGTGKEVAARMVHALSARHGKPFVVVNCAAIPRELFESELFGYRKGAFTGATGDKPGLLASAHGGTLFLDEVGDLSPENQARILRVVEQGTFRPVGGEEEIHLSLRIIAATNKDLLRCADAGSFRADLYHRLAAYHVVMPPLCEHKEDIPALVLHFIEQLQRQGKRPIEGIAPEALEALRRRGWPGNVRELRNCVQRAMAVSRGPVLQERDFLHQTDVGLGAEGTTTLDLAEMEKRHIKAVIDAHQGNLRAAAESLGIARSTLYKKISEYDIE